MERRRSTRHPRAGGGFALAFVFGAGRHKTNFCTMGAVSDVVNMGHWGRMRMWLLAIAVAMRRRHLLSYAGRSTWRSRSTSGRRCPGCRCCWAACCSASA